MAQVTFIPQQTSIEVEPNTKVLVAGRRAKVPIRFGCAACSCGTCAVRVDQPAHLSPMKENERQLLTRMGLSTTGEIRLSCQARVDTQPVTVDLDFQDTYSPDQLENQS